MDLTKLVWSKIKYKEIKKRLLIENGLIFVKTFGYIDPGSLSTVMVAIISAFVGVVMVLKTYWYKIKEKISGN